MGTISDKLSGKLIVLGVTGSIAAVEVVKLAHELLRNGAEVQSVMTASARRIIHPDALEFATGNRPIIELTGAVEHVSYCGEVGEKADLMLIAPATANTISKIAKGVDDTPVTTFATTAIGSKIPLLIVPAMHGTMYNNQFVIDNMDNISGKAGIEFIGPKMKEGKAKMANIPEIVAAVTRRLWKRDLNNRRVLVVAGSTAEPIDEFRVLTNRSSGRMGIELAKNAYQRGGAVTLWYGASPETYPEYIYTERFTKLDDLFTKMSFLDNDVTVVCAAIADYSPDKQRGKIPSGQQDLSIGLRPTPKVLSVLRDADKRTYLVGFKAEYDVSEQELLEKAFDRMERSKLDMIVANDLKEVGPDANHVYILHANRARKELRGTKSEIATVIFDEIIADLNTGSEFNNDSEEI